MKKRDVLITAVVIIMVAVVAGLFAPNEHPSKQETRVQHSTAFTKAQAKAYEAKLEAEDRQMKREGQEWDTPEGKFQLAEVKEILKLKGLSTAQTKCSIRAIEATLTPAQIAEIGWEGEWHRARGDEILGRFQYAVEACT